MKAFYNCCREESFLVRDGEVKASYLKCGSFGGDWGETDEDDKSLSSMLEKLEVRDVEIKASCLRC
jgi:hypothetical protein